MKHFILLTSIIFLTGCIPYTEVEKVAIINSRGIDLIEENGEHLIESTIISYKFDQNVTEMTSMSTGRSKTVKGGEVDAGKESSFLMTPGQIRMEIYGKEAAESGVLPHINILVRDAKVSDLMMLAVTTGKAKEILTAQQTEVKINSSQFLRELIEKETDLSRIPSSYLYDFSKKIEQIGADPVLPLIEIDDKIPNLTGLALFQNDKYVGNVSIQEAYLINQLMNTLKRAPIEVAVPYKAFEDLISDELATEEENIYLFLSLIKGTRQIKLVDSSNLRFEANVKLDVNLLEMSIPFSMSKLEDIQRIEKEIENNIKEQYNVLFEKLREKKVDPIGFGTIYYATREGRYLTKEKWTELIPDTKIDLNIDVTIKNFGTIL